jgi:5S rRNA maturation endonuclease (ribonuclease M5)
MEEINTIEKWIFEINNTKKIIIVEGPYDKKALENIGITNEVVVINDGTGLFETVEKVVKKVDKIINNDDQIIEKKEVIILTDFDKKGKELYKKFKKDLIKHGVKIDSTFREWLRRRTKVSHIEGIDSYVEHDGYVRK